MDTILHHLQQFLFFHRFFTCFFGLIKDLKSLPTGMDITQLENQPQIFPVGCLRRWSALRFDVEPAEAGKTSSAMCVDFSSPNLYDKKKRGVYASKKQEFKGCCRMHPCYQYKGRGTSADWKTAEFCIFWSRRFLRLRMTAMTSLILRWFKICLSSVEMAWDKHLLNT